MKLLVCRKPLIYIGFELGISSNFPPSWPKKGLQILNFGKKTPKISIKNQKNPYNKVQNSSKLLGPTPFSWAPGHMEHSIWIRAKCWAYSSDPTPFDLVEPQTFGRMTGHVSAALNIHVPTFGSSSWSTALVRWAIPPPTRAYPQSSVHINIKP
jgi:hypothetical protein